jgi:hypothetical protein
MPKRLCSLLISVLILMIAVTVSAQDNPVPDLTGLNMPQAAAALNRAGFALGEVNAAIWSEGSGIPQNTVLNQSIAAGQTAAAASRINITIGRVPNLILRYDENDLSVLNRSGVEMNLTGMVFNAKDTSRPAAMGIDRWNTTTLKTDDCLQVWSIGRRSPKETEGCGFFYWLSSTNPDFHFWTALNGVNTFNVTISGLQYAVCPAAQAGAEPIDCAVYLPVNAFDDVTPFVQFSYTPTQLTIFNRTEDRWMSLVGLNVGGLAIGDPALYGNPTTVGIIPLLAPVQCLAFGEGAPQEACDEIARSTTAPFWNVPFTISGTWTGSDYQCPAATEGKITVCIMPR